MRIELRQALISYQDCRMLALSSGRRPFFRTRIAACCCSLPQAWVGVGLSNEDASVASMAADLARPPHSRSGRCYLRFVSYMYITFEYHLYQ